MIEINLLPPELKKKRGSKILGGKFNLPPEVMIGLGGGMVAFLIIVHILLMLTNIARLAQYKSLKKEWDRMLPHKGEADNVVKELRNLQAKLKSIDQVSGQELYLWCQKLNIISDSIPRGLWLRKVSLNVHNLSIEGSAISKKDQERVNIHAFASNLKKEEKFMNSLTNLELGSIQRRNINKVEIADFVMTAKTK